jgi:hypothetical protein
MTKIIIDGDFVKIPELDVWVWLHWLETDEGFLSYIYHMTEKRWATRQIIREFIRVVSEYRKLRIFDIDMEKEEGLEWLKYWIGKQHDEEK